MKKVLIFIFIIASSILLAQNPVGKGTYSVGGIINFSSRSESGYAEFNNSGFISKIDRSNSSNIFTFAPSAGYFFFDNLYTGISLQYTYESYADYSFSRYGLGPEIRYYFNVEIVKPFLGLEYTYSSGSSDMSTIDDTQSNFTVKGGIDYFITSYFALEAGLNYTISDLEHKSGGIKSDIEVKSFNIGIGAKFFIH